MTGQNQILQDFWGLFVGTVLYLLCHKLDCLSDQRVIRYLGIVL